MSRVEWRGFVNIALFDQDKKAIKRLAAENGDVWALIDDLLQSGYKITFSPDFENDCVTVSLTGWHDMTKPNDGLTMTQRHADPRVAFLAALFVHMEKTGGEWEKFDGSEDVEW